MWMRSSGSKRGGSLSVLCMVGWLASGCGAGAGDDGSESIAIAREALELTRSTRSVVSGRSHSCAIVFGGQVKCWGSSAQGQLGQGDTQARGDGPGELGWSLAPVNLGTGRTAKALAAGHYHTCALLDDASVKCWGMNLYGQLGQGDTAARGDGANEMGDQLAPVALGSGRTAKAIVSGPFHSCAVLDDSSLKCWGLNAYGELGLGDTAARGDGPNEMGNALGAVSLGTGRSAKSVVIGSYHTCAILDNGSLKCWGRNAYGQLGLDDIQDRGDGANEMGDALAAVNLGAGIKVKAAALGENHTCALLDNGSLKCWGRNQAGQLGVGDTLARGDAAGEMAALGAVSLGAGRVVTDIAAGSNHNCAVFQTGSIKCWGASGYGQLGLGNQLSKGDGAGEMGDSLPEVSLGSAVRVRGLSLGYTHSCARLDDSSLKCWGSNESGQLGLGDTLSRGDAAAANFMGDSLRRIDLGRAPKELVAGQAHVCAILDNDDMKCWGGAWGGQILAQTTSAKGDNPGEMGANLLPIVLGSGQKSKSVTAGWEHSCAVRADGKVKCWGANSYGQLGLGDTLSRGDSPGETGLSNGIVDLGNGRTAIAVRAGGFHSCAILDNGQLKCWGKNTYGQLGIGSTAHRGDGPGEMGDSLPAIDLGTGRTAREVVPGWGHTCALLDDYSVKCWGGSGSGQLGLGSQSHRGDAPGEMGDALPVVNLGSGRTARGLTSGYGHTCAVLDTGFVKCWGANESGQLGLGDLNNRGDQANEMGDLLPTVALGTSRKALSLSAWRTHTCALLDNGTVKCWGDNAYGQLGQGDTTRRGDGPNEMGDALPAVVLAPGRAATAVVAGGFFTCAALDSGQIKCWGKNDYGQLGQGDTVVRGDNANEMGAQLLPVPTGSSLASRFLGSDPNALAVVEGFPYDLTDPAMRKQDGNFDTSTFGYKLLSAFHMLGMSTTTFQPEPARPELERLHDFQTSGGFTVENMVRSNVLVALDAALVTREASLATSGPQFPLYDHMETLDPSTISKDSLASLYSLPLKALPAALQMGFSESLYCVRTQCLGFINDANGTAVPVPINESSDYRFVGAYFAPYAPGEHRMPPAASVVTTVLHEFAHYIDNYDNLTLEPTRPVQRSVPTQAFHNLSYDMAQLSGVCAPRRSTNKQDWITAYGYQVSGGGCPAGTALIVEEFADAFAVYVAQGRRFRTAAQQNSVISAKYQWLKTNVFQNREYDTDLQADWETGCNDEYGTQSRLPGYLSCNEKKIWDGTLPTLP